MLGRLHTFHETQGISPFAFRCPSYSICPPNWVLGKERGQLLNLRFAFGNTIPEYPGNYERGLLSIGGERFPNLRQHSVAVPMSTMKCTDRPPAFDKQRFVRLKRERNQDLELIKDQGVPLRIAYRGND